MLSSREARRKTDEEVVTSGTNPYERMIAEGGL